MDNENTQTNTEQQNTAPQEQRPTATPEQIADALLTAIDAKNRRNENSITKSFAEQYGMSEDEVRGVLAAEKQKRAEAIPPAVQQKMDEAMEKANDRLITADITAKATAMGCVDVDALKLLIDKSGITVDENGAVAGVDEALTSLKESKAYLFAASNEAPQKGASGLNHDDGADDADVQKIRAALGLK